MRDNDFFKTENTYDYNETPRLILGDHGRRHIIFFYDMIWFGKGYSFVHIININTKIKHNKREDKCSCVKDLSQKRISD
jgi:hypothetical protein